MIVWVSVVEAAVADGRIYSNVDSPLCSNTVTLSSRFMFARLRYPFVVLTPDNCRKLSLDPSV